VLFGLVVEMEILGVMSKKWRNDLEADEEGCHHPL
jgi:hypothetical protein